MFCLFPLSLNQNKKSSNYFSEAAIVSSLLLPKTKMKKFYGGFTIQTKYLSSSTIETSRLRIFWGMSWILFQLFIWYIASLLILYYNWYSIVFSPAKQRKRGKRQRDEEAEISDGSEQRLERLEQRGEQQRGQQRAEQRLERNQLWGSARDVASSCKRLHTDQKLRSEPVGGFSLTDKTYLVSIRIWAFSQPFKSWDLSVKMWAQTKQAKAGGSNNLVLLKRR